MSGRRPRPSSATGESADLLEQLVKSAVERCQAVRPGPRPRAREPPHVAGRAGRHRAGRHARLHLRAGVPAAGRVRRAGARHGRRGRQPVPDRREARQRHRRARRGRRRWRRASSASPPPRSTCSRAPSAGAPFERDADGGAAADDGAFESTLFRVKESFDYFVQSAGVRSRGLPDRGRRAAVRRADGDGVRLPGLHRARAAHDRPGRRHRGAARHHGPPARALDDGDEGGPHRARREGASCR